MRQDKRRFVEKVDFVTTPGYLDGPGSRERAGLPADTGPFRVITQLGVFDFEEETKQLRLLALHPGVSIDEVQANSAFEVLLSENMEITEPPSQEELRLLREIDPLGMVIGK
jgi:acyl CoA:acetate/3-ketoacid CoA transferase beta subunit